MSDRQLPQGVTPEQVQELVRKHSKVHTIIVRKGDKTYVALLKHPTIAIMGAATVSAQVGGAVDPYKMGSMIYNSCKLHVDSEIDADEEMRAGVMMKANTLFRIAETELGEVYAEG